MYEIKSLKRQSIIFSQSYELLSIDCKLSSFCVLFCYLIKSSKKKAYFENFQYIDFMIMAYPIIMLKNQHKGHPQSRVNIWLTEL